MEQAAQIVCVYVCHIRDILGTFKDILLGHIRDITGADWCKLHRATRSRRSRRSRKRGGGAGGAGKKEEEEEEEG